MKTTFTFKGFELILKESKNEQVIVKVGEVATTVEDLEFKEYVDFAMNVPKLIREIGEAMIDVQSQQHQHEMQVRHDYEHMHE